MSRRDSNLGPILAICSLLTIYLRLTQLSNHHLQNIVNHAHYFIINKNTVCSTYYNKFCPESLTASSWYTVFSMKKPRARSATHHVTIFNAAFGSDIFSNFMSVGSRILWWLLFVILRLLCLCPVVRFLYLYSGFGNFVLEL